MHSILILANAFFMIRDIFHLYVFASLLKSNISFGAARLLLLLKIKHLWHKNISNYFLWFPPLKSSNCLSSCSGRGREESVPVPVPVLYTVNLGGNGAAWCCPVQNHQKKSKGEAVGNFWLPLTITPKLPGKTSQQITFYSIIVFPMGSSRRFLRWSESILCLP